MPWTLPGARSAVTTVTPVANCPQAKRNSAGVGGFRRHDLRFSKISYRMADRSAERGASIDAEARWNVSITKCHAVDSALPAALISGTERTVMTANGGDFGWHGTRRNRLGQSPRASGRARRDRFARRAARPGSGEAACASRSVGRRRLAGTDNASAAAQCEVAVLTVPFSGLTALLEATETGVEAGHDRDRHHRAAGGCRLAARRRGCLGVWQGSAAEAAKELLPQGVSIAAAFHNLGAALLTGDARGGVRRPGLQRRRQSQAGRHGAGGENSRSARLERRKARECTDRGVESRRC